MPYVAPHGAMMSQDVVPVVTKFTTGTKGGYEIRSAAGRGPAADDEMRNAVGTAYRWCTRHFHSELGSGPQ